MASIPSAPDDILSWTNQDPRESQLFNSWGPLYRFKVCPLLILRLLPVAQSRNSPLLPKMALASPPSGASFARTKKIALQN
jgi:hypothetical protein